jgi:hypothetical protein
VEEKVGHVRGTTDSRCIVDIHAPLEGLQ